MVCDLLHIFGLLQQTHEVETKTGSQARWWMQLSTLIRRSSLNMSRDVGYYWLRLIVYILVSFGVGTIYFDVGTSYTAILARGACGAFISGFMTFMSIGGFPSFLEEMKVTTRFSCHVPGRIVVLYSCLSRGVGNHKLKNVKKLKILHIIFCVRKTNLFSLVTKTIFYLYFFRSISGLSMQT